MLKKWLFIENKLQVDTKLGKWLTHRERKILLFFRNALSLDLLSELKGELIKTHNDKSVQVVILGHTGKVFSAGHDLKELVGRFPSIERESVSL